MVVWDETNIQGRALIKKPSSSISVKLCRGATFILEEKLPTSYLIHPVYTFNFASPGLPTFCILRVIHSGDFELDLCHAIPQQ